MEITDITAQADGRAVVAGFVGLGASSGPFLGIVARLTPDGLLDRSFANDGIATFAPGPALDGVELDPDGRILAGGSFSDSGGQLTGTEIAVVRLHPDGDIDPTFSDDGIATRSPGITSRSAFSHRLPSISRSGRTAAPSSRPGPSPTPLS